MHKWQITTRQSASTMINVQTGIAKETWSQQIEMFLGNKARLDMLEQLQNQA